MPKTTTPLTFHATVQSVRRCTIDDPDGSARYEVALNHPSSRFEFYTDEPLAIDSAYDITIALAPEEGP